MASVTKTNPCCNHHKQCSTEAVLTLTRCPKAKAKAFCTTVLLSRMPFSKALISLPENNNNNNKNQ